MFYNLIGLYEQQCFEHEIEQNKSWKEFRQENLVCLEFHSDISIGLYRHSIIAYHTLA